MRRTWQAVAPLVLGAAAALGRWVARARVPDDYDSIGFVHALDDFDVARLQPHFPGYPVFVALGRAVRALGVAPLDAACAVSAIAGGVTVLAVWVVARRLGGAAAGWRAALLCTGAALPWLLGGSALSDATAAALAVGAFASWAVAAPAASGALLGLMLGARLSYAPLALPWLVLAWRDRERRTRALAGLGAGTAAWAIPFFAVVGVRQFAALGAVHLRGHFTVWGGSIHTQPGLGARAWALGRALWLDGLAPSPWAAGALAVLVLAALARPHDPGKKSTIVRIALGAAPYAMWVWLGQNIVAQPRHALPLVLALVVVLGLVLPTWAAVLACALVTATGASLAWRHATTEPAAAQAARTLVPAPDRIVFGGRSIRFVQLLAPGVLARERTWLSEVDVDLERVDPLPSHVVVTSELEADAARARRLRPLGTFCRDARLDRREPCLTLFEYSLGAAP